jgi:hypothetical protein
MLVIARRRTPQAGKIVEMTLCELGVIRVPEIKNFRHSEGASATEESPDAKGILRVVPLPSE